MDEEDGRPGARAIHFGPTDAPHGVPTNPMQFIDRHSKRSEEPVFVSLAASTALLQNEENNENVPGK
jgi:hypothetical protein